MTVIDQPKTDYRKKGLEAPCFSCGDEKPPKSLVFATPLLYNTLGENKCSIIISTVGGAPLEIIKQHIENQKSV